jgi:hypothetical protein
VTFLEWTLVMVLIVAYIALLCTVCLLTFRKGYWLLGFLGIFFPILWLLGAVLPAKPGSRYDVEETWRRDAAARAYGR